MSTQMYLQIDGIPGGSTNPRHFGEIEISGFTFGGSQKLMAVTQALSDYTEMTSPHDLTINKGADISSTRMQMAVVNGETFPKGSLSLEVSVNGALQRAMKIEMQSINFTSFSSGGRTEAQETATITFGRVNVSYRQ